MHKIDKTSKRYLSDAARFADCFNAVVCHGKQVIKAEDIQENKEGFQNLAEDAYDFLSAATHSKELERMREEIREAEKENILQEGRKVNMCKAIRDMIEDGKQEGRQEGRQEGIKETIKIFKLNALGKSVEDISKECEVTAEQVEEIINMFAI